jgi:hypothetical protein
MGNMPARVRIHCRIVVMAALITLGAGAGCNTRPAGQPDGGGDAPAADTPAGDWLNTGDGPIILPLSCHYNGLDYAAGTTFLSSDGCNACQCAVGGQVTCGTATCPVAGVTCTVAGTIYAAGDLLPGVGVSACDTCACAASGEILCAQRYCPGGQCVFGFDDTCNEDPTVRTPRGTCQANGMCACGANPINPRTGHCLTPGHDVQSGCELGGVIHPDGSSFLCADGCNSCACAGREVYATTTGTICGAPQCGLDDAIVFGYRDSIDAQDHLVTLTPAPTATSQVTYVHTRTDAGGVTASCSPSLPACADPDVVDMSELAVDLQDPIVHELLANPGPAAVVLGAPDTPAVSIRRGTGPGILIGGDCIGSTPSCNAIPETVQRLAYDLRTFDDQRIDRSRTCEVLAPPTFACGAVVCNSRTEYCASTQVNGAHKLDVCRPYPAGCDSCGCALDDALPALKQAYPPCDLSFTRCSAGARPIGPDDVSATLTIACTEG